MWRLGLSLVIFVGWAVVAGCFGHIGGMLGVSAAVTLREEIPGT